MKVKNELEDVDRDHKVPSSASSEVPLDPKPGYKPNPKPKKVSQINPKNNQSVDPIFIMAQSDKVEVGPTNSNMFDDLSDFYADDAEFERIDLKQIDGESLKQ